MYDALGCPEATIWSCIFMWNKDRLKACESPRDLVSRALKRGRIMNGFSLSGACFIREGEAGPNYNINFDA